MEIESLRLAFFIVADHQVCRSFRWRVRLQLALSSFLRLFLLFLLSRTLFLTFRKGGTRVSGHQSSWVLTDKVSPQIHRTEVFRSGPRVLKKQSRRHRPPALNWRITIPERSRLAILLPL